MSNDKVVDLTQFRKPTLPSKMRKFLVQDKTGAIHQITADKMGSSPTAVVFFLGEDQVFLIPMDLLYVAQIEDQAIVNSFRPATAQTEPVAQDNETPPEVA